jgi:hypothetical protein
LDRAKYLYSLLPPAPLEIAVYCYPVLFVDFITKADFDSVGQPSACFVSSQESPEILHPTTTTIATPSYSPHRRVTTGTAARTLYFFDVEQPRC